jgi:hypothetical protein
MKIFLDKKIRKRNARKVQREPKGFELEEKLTFLKADSKQQINFLRRNSCEWMNFCMKMVHFCCERIGVAHLACAFPLK